MEGNTGEAIIQVLWEAHEGRSGTMADFIVDRAKAAHKRVNHGAVAIIIRDKDGKFLGSDVSGEASPELKRRYAEQIAESE